MYGHTLLCLLQVQFRTEVLRSPSSTRAGFELMTSRSWQYIPCQWDSCSNHLAISDFSYLKHESRHQTTSEMGCQLGDYRWSLQASFAACVGMFGLKYSLYHPWVEPEPEISIASASLFESPSIWNPLTSLRKCNSSLHSFLKSLMAEWSRWWLLRDMKCTVHYLEVMSLNPGQIKLVALSTI